MLYTWRPEIPRYSQLNHAEVRNGCSVFCNGGDDDDDDGCEVSGIFGGG